MPPTLLGHPLCVAAVCTGYGPQGFIRHAALARVAGVDPVYIAVGTTRQTRSWHPNPEAYPFRTITLFDRPFEQVPFREQRRALEHELRALRPGAVCVYGYSDPIMRWAARWAKQNGAAAVAFWETARIDRPRQFVREWLKRRFVSQTLDGAFVSGVRGAAYARELGVAESRVVPGYSVVDNEHFRRGSEAARNQAAQLRARLELPNQFALYVGRFAPEKNLPTLLRAYAAYRRGQPLPWSLVLVGTGKQEQELRSLTHALHLTDVHWVPFQTQEKLPQFYGLASCLVLPSTVEPWGLVVNEAMAAGLPVLVSTRCGCVPELVREGVNGFTLQPNDVAGLAGLMARMAANTTDRAAMGRASQEIIADYTPETWAQHLLELIDRVRQASRR
ncbi:MAG: glycosyltransferase family 4 protein [Armatimonadetes bacterium]|nr:glycosyltransferase family 4 protein [Armatimonadota bacterium]